MNEIKSCPFCGGKAEIRNVNPNKKTAPHYAVVCTECGARTPGFCGANRNIKNKGLFECIENERKNYALERWNKRTANE